MPLRDAVEKRPPPDQSYDPSDDIAMEIEAAYKDQPFLQTRFSPFSGSYQGNSQRYVLSNQRLQAPASSLRYNPFDYFGGIVGDYLDAPPYRVDNFYQQLIMNPAIPRRGRSLNTKNPFLKTSHDNYDSGKKTFFCMN